MTHLHPTRPITVGDLLDLVSHLNEERGKLLERGKQEALDKKLTLSAMSIAQGSAIGSVADTLLKFIKGEL